MADDYIAQLARLTDEEQALRALEWREPRDLARLAAIADERTRLWNLERARRCGAAPPPGEWRVDRPLWSSERRAAALSGPRLPVASGRALQRELIAYQEQTHAPPQTIAD